MTFALPIDPAANELLARDPLAALLGMTLDQQVTMEKAFSSPYVLAQRLGHEPTAQELADFDPEELAAIFATPPALHRFPKAFAAKCQAVCQVLVDQYGGSAAALWETAATGAELVKRVEALPSFGKQKAQIFVAVLGKRLGVRPKGWREAAGGYGPDEAYRSVADVVDEVSLAKVREYKKSVKAAAKAG